MNAAIKELTSAPNLETFMLRLEQTAPAEQCWGGFELVSAVAVMEAHREFIDRLNLGAALPQRQALLRKQIQALGREALGVQSSLLAFWESSTLSLSSKTAQAALARGAKAYVRAKARGHKLMSLLIPCSTGWYDATLGR